MIPRRNINFKVMKNNGNVFVGVNGHLDGTTAYEVRSTLQRIHGTCQGKTLVLDLRAIRFFEYFGIAALSRFINNHGRQFQEINLRGLRGPTQELFKRFGVENFDGTDGDS
jgi:anti-anti-sigma factor